VRFSDALDYLAWETLHWGETVNNMLQFFFNGVSREARQLANSFTQNNPPTVGCEDVELVDTGLLSSALSLTSNLSALFNDSDTFWERLSQDQLNPRFPAYPKGTCSQGGPPCQINYNNFADVAAQVGLPANFDPER
jgi:hypothetical protein